MVSRITERSTFITLAAIFFLFTTGVFDPEVGRLFLGLLLILFPVFITDKFAEIRIESRPDRLKSLTLGVIGVVSFFIVYNIAIGLFNLTVSRGIASITNIFSQTTPILAVNPLLLVSTFGFFIPIAESWGVGLMVEGIKDILKVNLNFRNIQTLFIVFAVGGLAVLYHSFAKGISNTPVLIAVFIFFAINAILVIIEKQIMGAILMHIIMNTFTLINTGTVVLGGIPIIALGIVSILFLFINKLPRITKT